jgi:hypothetical protein
VVVLPLLGGTRVDVGGLDLFAACPRGRIPNPNLGLGRFARPGPFASGHYIRLGFCVLLSPRTKTNSLGPFGSCPGDALKERSSGP